MLAQETNDIETQNRTPQKAEIRDKTAMSQETLLRECTFGEKAVEVRDLYTTRDIAMVTGINPVVIAAWVKLGLVPYIRLGNAIVVSRKDIERIQDSTAKRTA